MPQRPLILFPSPEQADREKNNGGFSNLNRPSYDRQFTRLQPAFDALNDAFQKKALKVQQSAVGINPEFALVFEIIGSVDNFYTAVKNTDGLEWIFDKKIDDIMPDDDFYQFDSESNDRLENPLNSKLYCVMSNQQAINQLLSLWHRHQNGETGVFKRGFAGIRDIFTCIKDIRKWDARDRIAETHAVEYWRESLEFCGDSPVSFEIELFYRSDISKRQAAIRNIQFEINKLNGKIIKECVISEIYYHGILVELPRAAIEDLVTKYEEIELSKVDDIMFFRPTCQSVFVSSNDSNEYTEKIDEFNLPSGEPVVAIFDGMPMQNHRLLKNRIIVDDPDDFATDYESKNRKHGTSMASFVIYGDINRHDLPISTPVYVRPILRPKLCGTDGETIEEVPDNYLLIDILHRAVKRMMEGDGDDQATAKNTRVVNLSIGDRVRQLGTTMSPVARLLDHLSYKYNILFIISAGNHDNIIHYVDKSFDELKKCAFPERNRAFGKAIKENQRNMKLLSPAESLNSLVIGALYDDFSDFEEQDNFILAVEKGMPSPISAFGKGYGSIISPDLFYYGGIKYIRKNYAGEKLWVNSLRAPGCLSAMPNGNVDGCGYSFGTSDAAAQITHEAAKCYDVLNEIFNNETGKNVPIESTAILLKAMLTHGASWDPIADKIADSMETSNKKLSQWIGNGVPNIERVMECTKDRITLIGLGSLKKDKGDIFKLPLSIDFSSRSIKRKLTVTLSYISPIAPNKQTYRGVQLWFSIDDGGKNLFECRQNTEWQNVRKGTLQHEIFTGDGPISWNDDELIIKVNCKEDAIKIKEAIPYCIFVSFEIAEGLDVDLYAEVSTKIRPKIPIINN